MNKAIVTTTINPPTEALKKFAEIAKTDGWNLVIVGDKKTPHDDYRDFEAKYECVTYLTPSYQEEMSQELSDLIGWNCIQRRNFGLLYAYNEGAEIIATIDDDNIPYPNWGKGCKVGKEINVSMYKVDDPVFDPLSVTHPDIWHRGFPVQLLDTRKVSHPRNSKRRVLVQADFWDGAPDVDAIARITLDPSIMFDQAMMSFCSNKPAPFNSQNTFLHRDCFPQYFLFPHIGRMDDIWAAYWLQKVYPDSVVFSKASVKQERNPHDLVKDLEAEMIGYRHTLEFVNFLAELKDIEAGVEWPEWFPVDSLKAWEVYRSLFKQEQKK